MFTPPRSELEARVQALERKVRQASIALAGFGVALAVMLLLGARQQADPPVADVLRARRIEIDGLRQVDGHPQVYTALRLGSSPEGGFIEAYRSDRRMGALPPMKLEPRGLSLGNAERWVDLTLHGLGVSEASVDGKGRVQLGPGRVSVWTPSGEVSLEGGRATFRRSETVSQPGAVRISGASISIESAGKEQVRLSGGEDGGQISVSSKTGEGVVTLGVDAQGNGEVGAWDRNGKGRTLKPGP